MKTGRQQGYVVSAGLIIIGQTCVIDPLEAPLTRSTDR